MNGIVCPEKRNNGQDIWITLDKIVFLQAEPGAAAMDIVWVAQDRTSWFEMAIQDVPDIHPYLAPSPNTGLRDNNKSDFSRFIQPAKLIWIAADMGLYLLGWNMKPGSSA